jgi:long-chain-fatty-acid--CoA ligase ACSBG
MVSNDNIVFETRAVLRAIEVVGTKPEEERIISYLPLSHVAGMMVDIVLPLICAAELPGWVCCFFARSYDLRVSSIVERFKAVRPTCFLGVPRVWEKIQAKMVAVRQALVASGEMSATAVRVSTWGKNLSLEHANARQLGGNGAKPFMYGTVAEGLVQKKAKGALGLDACKFAFTGAAPIAVETLRYFASIGININEVYGMSECTGVATWSTDRAHVWGSCGWAVPGVEVKVFKDGGGANTEVPHAKDLFKPTEEEQGELCYRGRNVMMGYLANPDLGPEHVADIEKKTKDTIDAQGWLHSGDKGCRDARGMFRVTGRYKELLIGAGGENIAPVPVEECIKALCPAISNVMMVGDKMPFNCALVTLKCVGANGELPGTSELDGETLAYQDSVAQAGDAKAKTVAEASKPGSALVKAIMAAIVATNKNEDACPMNAAKVQKFMILPLDFAVSTDDFTPTFKLKRATVHERFAEQIKLMYDSKDNYVPFPSA